MAFQRGGVIVVSSRRLVPSAACARRSLFPRAAAPATSKPHRFRKKGTVLDKYAIHGHARVCIWLRQRPRFVFHFIPARFTWLNLIERWFAELVVLSRPGHLPSSA